MKPWRPEKKKALVSGKKTEDQKKITGDQKKKALVFRKVA
jgi:hypothetical protein